MANIGLYIIFLTVLTMYVIVMKPFFHTHNAHITVVINGTEHLELAPRDFATQGLSHQVTKGLVINYGEGEGGGAATTWEKLLVRNLLCPPPLKTGSNLSRPSFKEWKLFHTPFNMAKTSSYRVKTIPFLL